MYLSHHLRVSTHTHEYICVNIYKLAESPFAVIVEKMNGAGELTEEVNHAVDENERALLQVMEEADKLRLNTLIKLLDIQMNKPVQAWHIYIYIYS